MESRNQRLMIIVMGGLTLVSIAFIGVQDVRLKREPITMSNIASAGFGALAAAWQINRSQDKDKGLPSPGEPSAVLNGKPVVKKPKQDDDDDEDRPEGFDPTEGP